MQLTIKAHGGDLIDMDLIVKRCLKNTVPNPIRNSIVVERLFPSAVTGNRVRMYSVQLPDTLSNLQVREILDTLQGSGEFEYAEIPNMRRAV